MWLCMDVGGFFSIALSENTRGSRIINKFAAFQLFSHMLDLTSDQDFDLTYLILFQMWCFCLNNYWLIWIVEKYQGFDNSPGASSHFSVIIPFPVSYRYEMKVFIIMCLMGFLSPFTGFSLIMDSEFFSIIFKELQFVSTIYNEQHHFLSYYINDVSQHILNCY